MNLDMMYLDMMSKFCVDSKEAEGGLCFSAANDLIRSLWVGKNDDLRCDSRPFIVLHTRASSSPSSHPIVSRPVRLSFLLPLLELGDVGHKSSSSSLTKRVFG